MKPGGLAGQSSAEGTSAVEMRVPFDESKNPISHDQRTAHRSESDHSSHGDSDADRHASSYSKERRRRQSARSRSPRRRTSSRHYDRHRASSWKGQQPRDHRLESYDRHRTREEPLSRRRRSRSTGREERQRTRRVGSIRSSERSSAYVKDSLPSQRNDLNEHLSTSDDAVTAVKQKPDFGTSGKLAVDANTVAGTSIVLKYNEPPEARKPSASHKWRLFVFKGSETLDQIELQNRSCWLFGREKAVADYFVENPSCSKQHAVIQFRFMEKRNEFGDQIGSVKPYLIDLESVNGSKINGEDIPNGRFVELKSGDVITFGESTREYVLVLP